jgi:catechol 2,3-dioxygenase
MSRRALVLHAIKESRKRDTKRRNAMSQPSSEPIRDVAHIGHFELFTPKLSQSLFYFQELLGMTVVHNERQSYYLRGYGDYAVSTLKLTESDQPGVGRIAWRMVSPQALDRRAKAIEQTGLAVGWNNGEFGRGRSFQFHDPDGHPMELYFEEDKYTAPASQKSTLRNQPMKYPGHGVGVRRSDHVALTCRDVAVNRRFMEDGLGLQLREQIRFENGAKEIGSWLSSTAMHHEIAYVADAADCSGRLHHFSLWVDNRDDVLRAADIFRENDITIETGPSRHNNSQAFYLYSFEPGGNRVEIYTSGFMVFAPDFDPIIWNEENREGGVYWGAKLPDSFRTYATPPQAPKTAQPAEQDLPTIDPY